LFEKAYFVKGITKKNKLELINGEQITKGSILDIGAGTGDFYLWQKKDGWNTTGIEPSDRAKAIAIGKGISFV
jgi:2-polyprenyl-3-methyl-5-hydroxy-6-metoxy-1,4-benzoquinol methylase